MFPQKIPKLGEGVGNKKEDYPDTGEKDPVRHAALPVFIRHSPSDVVVCQFPPDNDPQVHINKRNSCFVGGTWKLFLGLNLPKFWTRHFKLCEGAHYFLYSEKKIVTGARSV